MSQNSTARRTPRRQKPCGVTLVRLRERDQDYNSRLASRLNSRTRFRSKRNYVIVKAPRKGGEKPTQVLSARVVRQWLKQWILHPLEEKWVNLPIE
ncbi:hypothetical protein chiPu_0000785 [Chiloscyllium punctatum]|uniref:Uncharacterized protein n=1 Tax=Chiloscyllium punctatum TaxID=137246 RepID=A0A401RW87_CHIPU|nr:hypothetical protein [Chiloscyllium punctatum]